MVEQRSLNQICGSGRILGNSGFALQLRLFLFASEPTLPLIERDVRARGAAKLLRYGNLPGVMFAGLKKSGGIDGKLRSSPPVSTVRGRAPY